jgi:hypothetical protein
MRALSPEWAAESIVVPEKYVAAVRQAGRRQVAVIASAAWAESKQQNPHPHPHPVPATRNRYRLNTHSSLA